VAAIVVLTLAGAALSQSEPHGKEAPPVPRQSTSAPGKADQTKAELMGRVEDLFLHNARDITWRKSLEWGDVQTDAEGHRSIRYKYNATIWDKETLAMNQIFTFDRDGNLVRWKNVEGFPMPIQKKAVDVTTQNGMKSLVEEFFANNFRDITRRQTIEWGPVIKDEKGNSSIRYRYNATIRDKDQKVMDQVFTFDPQGKFVSVKDADAKVVPPTTRPAHDDQKTNDH
jgi:hypothetical protein